MSDPHGPEPVPVDEPPPVAPEPDEEEDDEEDLVARAANRAECKRLYGDIPCISILGRDEVTVVETDDCKGWCPALRKPV